VANGRQKYMDADCDSQGKQSDEANGYQQNAEPFPLAAGDRQHGGVSVSETIMVRNITSAGYARVGDLR
jgi:hypothetical protein